MEKQKVSVKTTLPYKEAVAYMEDLLASLKSGKIVVSDGDKSVTLTPDESVGIEVEAKAKGDKQKFSFKLIWGESGKSKLTISDKEPDSLPAKKETSAVVKKTPAKTPIKKKPAKTPAKKVAAKSPAKKPAAKLPSSKKGNAK